MSSKYCRWAVEHCPTSRFYFFADDDYYVSTRNVLRFLRNPINFPQYLEDPVLSFDDDRPVGVRTLKQMVDFDLPDDAVLFAGQVMHPAPIRFRLSKWFIDWDEYKFNKYP